MGHPVKLFQNISFPTLQVAIKESKGIRSEIKGNHIFESHYSLNCRHSILYPSSHPSNYDAGGSTEAAINQFGAHLYLGGGMQ